MELFLNWLQQSGVDETPTMLAVHVGLVLIAVVVFNFILRRVLTRLEKGVEKTATLWDDALIKAARHPVSWLAWVIGLAFAAQIIGEKAQIAAFNVIPTVRSIGIIVCLACFLVRLIRNMQHAIIKRKTDRGESFDRTMIDTVSQILRVLVWIVAALVGLDILKFSISGVLAFGGIGGIAVGFAAKDLLANFFGSLMIHMDRPFAVGDWIRSSEKQIEGNVEEIGWRITRIRTLDKRPLYVPNAIFTSITVENPSRMSNRRINETIGVRYDDIGEVAGIVADIRAMLMAHPDIDQAPGVTVGFTKFSDFSLDILVNTFTRTVIGICFHEVKQDVLLKIADIIAAHGAEIAYPTHITYSSPLPPQDAGRTGNSIDAAGTNAVRL